MARAEVKAKRKLHKEAITTRNPENIKKALQDLVEAQRNLRKEIEEMEKQRTKEELQKMKSEGEREQKKKYNFRAKLLNQD